MFITLLNKNHNSFLVCDLKVQKKLGKSFKPHRFMHFSGFFRTLKFQIGIFLIEINSTFIFNFKIMNHNLIAGYIKRKITTIIINNKIVYTTQRHSLTSVRAVVQNPHKSIVGV